MKAFLAGLAVALGFTSGCGGVESGSAGSLRDATVPEREGGLDAPAAPVDSPSADVDAGLVEAARDSSPPDAGTAEGHPDGSTYCLACYVGCDAGFWCAPEERCTSVGTQPSGPQACCPDKDAAAHGAHCHD
jgi:hypothetical protein